MSARDEVAIEGGAAVQRVPLPDHARARTVTWQTHRTANETDEVATRGKPVEVAVTPFATDTPTASRRRRVLRHDALRPGEGPTAALSVASVTGLALLWWAATRLGWIPPLFLPSPATVWRAFVDAWHGNIQGGVPLAQHLGWSALRVFGAFALAAIAGVPVGILMGVNRIARGLLDPLLEFYRPLPPLAYLPLVVIWFGIDETAKIVVIFLACFAPIAMAARAGVRSATSEQIAAAYSLGGSTAQVVRHVVLPAALPEILTGLRIAIGFGWTTLVAAEMVAATAGLGQMVLNASSFLRTDVVVMGIVLIGLIAWGFDLAMRALERRLVPWKGRG